MGKLNEQGKGRRSQGAKCDGDTGGGDSGEEPLPETENFSSRPVLEADEVVSNFGGGFNEVPGAVGAAVGGDEGPSEDSTSAVGRETGVGIGTSLVSRTVGSMTKTEWNKEPVKAGWKSRALAENQSSTRGTGKERMDQRGEEVEGEGEKR
ncbi:hypothetical protein CYMTET_45647 [Cymbomonas tetramitiformis]|uniref:Uncharacterized protein n=1 Tax=Cymbomonas tetramitiformis TaxID=36881 RepID=A0AAE0BZL1_9CHLO|nr:hypothetical protein CYMTET_45647 [Cymbomonas tetramitiformis]